jgi:rare lipoprotein A
LPAKQAAVFSFVNEPETKLSITATTVGSMFKQYQAEEQTLDILPQPSQVLAEKLPPETLYLSEAVGSDTLDLPVEPAKLPAVEPLILSTQVGGASWYGYEGGTVTATGERYNPRSLTAAHRTLPFGSKVLVTNLRNNQSVIVHINNRGPFIRGRIIDLSEAAAAEVGIKSTGVGKVRIDILSYGDGQRKSRR